MARNGGGRSPGRRRRFSPFLPERTSPARDDRPLRLRRWKPRLPSLAARGSPSSDTERLPASFTSLCHSSWVSSTRYPYPVPYNSLPPTSVDSARSVGASVDRDAGPGRASVRFLGMPGKSTALQSSWISKLPRVFRFAPANLHAAVFAIPVFECQQSADCCIQASIGIR